MRLYEFIFIVHHGLTQQEVEGLIQELASLLTSLGSSLIKREYCGLLDFEYPIDNSSKGHYCLLYIESSESDEGMKEFKRKIKLMEEVIRYLCLRVDSIPQGDSFMLASGN